MGEIYIEMKNQSDKLICIDSGSGPGMTKWGGSCRVDVVAVILDEGLRVEEIRHHQAVY
jgi:hypothetical protein